MIADEELLQIESNILLERRQPQMQLHKKLIPSLILILAFAGNASAAVSSEDKPYMNQVKQKLMALSDKDSQKLLLGYLAYLESGQRAEAQSYVRRLKEYAFRNGAEISGIAIFEGDSNLCEYKDSACGKSVGSLTQTYLVPRLDKGDKDALEVFYVYTALAKMDGAEGGGVGEILYEHQLPTKFQKEFAALKQKHDADFKKLGVDWSARWVSPE